MKVILLKQKRGLGKVGEMVTVKNGFGRNFLVPQGFAVRATAENEQKILEQKVELEEHNAEAHKHAEAASKKIAGKDFTFIRQCADDGRLFGSVSAKEIAKVLHDATGVEVSHAGIFLPHPLKSLGVYDVTVALHADTMCQVLINIGRSESEAKDALIEHKSGAAKENKESAQTATAEGDDDGVAA